MLHRGRRLHDPRWQRYSFSYLCVTSNCNCQETTQTTRTGYPISRRKVCFPSAKPLLLAPFHYRQDLHIDQRHSSPNQVPLHRHTGVQRLVLQSSLFLDNFGILQIPTSFWKVHIYEHIVAVHFLHIPPDHAYTRCQNQVESHRFYNINTY